MRVLVAPDSFKGSLSAAEVCAIVSEAVKAAVEGCEVDCIPVADGGEGTAESFVFACSAELKTVVVTGPDGKRVNAQIALLGDTAVIESAQACGLPLAGADNNPVFATTYGVGEMIKAALDMGCVNIVIGIGGSATNDAGIGCLSALGVRFLNGNGSSVELNGCGMSKVETVDISGLDSRIKDCNITVLCDVENSLYGENGAAYVYAPQKGATQEEVVFLDNALRSFSSAVKTCLGADFADMPGAGAAGGMGYGFRTFLNAELKKGAKTVLDLCDFDSRVSKADAVITGEGRFDSQSLMGKVPGEVVARSGGKPVAVICGTSLADRGFDSVEVFETNPGHLPFESVLPYCREALYKTAFDKVSQFLKKI